MGLSNNSFFNTNKKNKNMKSTESKNNISNTINDEYDSGGYLFISHSHKDIEKVRQIRNKLEEAGFEPLCFFLKCLSDEDEIEDLIKREIDAREWFLYADSPNARKSKWVKTERKYIESVGTKKTITVDIEKNDSMDKISQILTKELSVNLIYSYKDSDFAIRLADKLEEKELRVTGLMRELNLNSNEDYENIISNNIEKASKKGTNIVILSKNSIQSRFILLETSYAFEHNSQIIPVIIDDNLKVPGSLRLILGNKKSLFNEKPIKNEKDLDNFIEYVVNQIQKSLNNKFN